MAFNETFQNTTDTEFARIAATLPLSQVTHRLGGRNRGPERHKVRERAHRLGVPFGTGVPPREGALFRIYTKDEPSRWTAIRNTFVKEKGHKCSYKGCTVTTDIAVHHRNGNKLDNRRCNLQVLCRHHHNVVEGKLMALSAADRQEFINIADHSDHCSSDGRRDWVKIKAKMSQSTSKELRALAKFKSDRLSSRRTSYNASAGTKTGITVREMTVDEYLSLKAEAASYGIRFKPLPNAG